MIERSDCPTLVYPKTKTAALRRARLIAISTDATVTVKRSDDNGASWQVLA